MDKAAVADFKIDKMDARVGVSKEGSDWMKTALDPFPDDPRDCEGYPDVVNGPSIVQKLKYQNTVTAPSSAGGGNWDALIYFDFWDNEYWVQQQDPLNTATSYPGGLQYAPPLTWLANSADSHINMGGLNIRSGPAGSPLTVAQTTACIPIPDNYFQAGRTRVIAKAFEIHNTTAEIAKQGAISVYRNPVVASGRTTGCALPVNGAPWAGFFTIEFGENTPTTIDQVMNILDSKEWKAADGAYCVATLADTNIPISSPADWSFNSVIPVVVEYNNPGIPTFYVTDMTLDPAITGSSTSGMITPRRDWPTGVQRGSFNQSGAFLTGLSPTTSLTIIVHYVLERFPDQTNKDLVVLTTRSPAFDPAALELYSRTASYLPTGVPVKDNASGDWIKNIADMLATCGVPGMPFVKGAVDLYNGLPSLDPSVKVKAPKKNTGKADKQIRQQLANTNAKLRTLEKSVNNNPPPRRQKQLALIPGANRPPNLQRARIKQPRSGKGNPWNSRGPGNPRGGFNV